MLYNKIYLEIFRSDIYIYQVFVLLYKQTNQFKFKEKIQDSFSTVLFIYRII